jgi:hypothetical protein
MAARDFIRCWFTAMALLHQLIESKKLNVIFFKFGAKNVFVDEMRCCVS